MNKRILGNMGESIACDYLSIEKYRIVDRNVYFKGGEIDIVAFDYKTRELVFIEVKTRTNMSYGRPAEAISYVKLARMRNGAKNYIYQKRWNNINIRLDAIEIYLKDKKIGVNHIKQII